MAKYERWQFLVNKEMENDINFLKSSYKQTLGREPSKSDIMSILIENFRKEKCNMTRKRKSKKIKLY